MVKLALAAALLVGLTACSGASPLSLLKGRPVGVNAQIGKENDQVVGVKNDYGGNTVTITPAVSKDHTPSGSTKSQSKPTKIEQVQSQESVVQSDEVQNVTVNEVPPWIILVAILGWLLPTPTQIGRGILRVVTFGRYK